MWARDNHATIFVPMDWNCGVVWSPPAVSEIDMCRDHPSDKTFKFNPGRRVAMWIWPTRRKAAWARQRDACCLEPTDRIPLSWLFPRPHHHHHTLPSLPALSTHSEPPPHSENRPTPFCSPTPADSMVSQCTCTLWISAVLLYQLICQLGFLSSSHQLSSQAALRHCGSRDGMGVVCHETVCWYRVCAKGRLLAFAVSRMFPRRMEIFEFFCKTFVLAWTDTALQEILILISLWCRKCYIYFVCR